MGTFSLSISPRNIYAFTGHLGFLPIHDCSEFTCVVSKTSSSQAVPTFVSREGEKEKGVNQESKMQEGE